MAAINSNGFSKYLIFIFYLLLFVLVGVYVFVANDETQPISRIFQLNYLVPVSMYSFASVGLSFIIYLVLQNKLPKVMSILISTLVGIPVGILLMILFFNLLTEIG